MTKKIISEILNELYSNYKKDTFYSIPNVKECDIRNEIYSKMKEKGIKNNNYLDLYIFTSEIGNNAILKELLED